MASYCIRLHLPPHVPRNWCGVLILVHDSGSRSAPEEPRGDAIPHLVCRQRVLQRYLMLCYRVTLQPDICNLTSDARSSR